MSNERGKSHELHARVIRAMVVCGSLTVQEASFKSDVSYRTSKRVLDALLSEGLVKAEPNPGFKNSTLYTWVY